MIVGRSSGAVDLSPFLDETARRGVSREHLRLNLDADRLTLTDLSRNGTLLILRDGTRLDIHQATHPFTVGDRAQIHPTLEIIRSGRRYPSELSAHRRASPPARDDPPTSTVSF
jgi:FHA domain